MRLSTKIYSSKKVLFMSKMHMSDDTYSGLLKVDLDYGLSLIQKYGYRGKLVAMYKYLWCYKRQIHAVFSSDLPDMRFTNHAVLNLDLIGDRGLSIDANICGRILYIHIIKLLNPIIFNGIDYSHSITLYNESLETQVLYVSSKSKGRTVLFKKRFDSCTKCNRCGKVQSDDKLRVANIMNLMRSCPEHARKWSDVGCILYVVGYTLNWYGSHVSKEVKHRSNDKSLHRKCAIVEPCESDDYSDTERIVTVINKEYTYRESTKRRRLSGTHKSPVSHYRSGYYRKSSCGDHILVDGEFVPVVKGQGTYTWVHPTIVNPNKDTSIADVIR